MDRIIRFLLLLSIAFASGCAHDKLMSSFHDVLNRKSIVDREDVIRPRPQHFETELRQVAHDQRESRWEVEAVAQAITEIQPGEQPLDRLDEVNEATLKLSAPEECLPPGSCEPDSSVQDETPDPPTVATSDESGADNEIDDVSEVEDTQFIDFRNALAIAVGQNPQVAFAAAQIREAYAIHTGARTMWLPNFSMGASFYSHNGQLQNAVGDVFDIDRGAILAGLGVRATGTSTPKIPGLATQFAIADAVYEPIISRQQYVARMHDAAATTNDVLLATSLAYLDLLNAHQLNSISEETRERAADLVKLTSSFARAGQGPQSDADRAATELTARCYKVARSIEAKEIASARLAQHLSLDLGAQLVPVETELIPVQFVDDSEKLPSLLEIGLRSRKELASSKHLVEAACAQLHKERASPLLPRLGFTASYGGFGGGRNSDYGRDFGPRVDFETYAYWQLRNLGFGERAARHAAGARLDQARAKQVQLIDQVAREISEAYARSRSRSRCIAITRKGIESAEFAFERDVKRIRHGEGLPIEALTSLRALDEARRDYANAIFEHNQSQFELLRAIGWPGGQNAIDLPSNSDEPIPDGPSP